MVGSQFELPRNAALGPVSPDGPTASWGFSQAVLGAGFVQWSLRNFGLRVPRENRTRRAAEVVELAGQTPWDELAVEFQRDVSQAARTVMEQYLIVRAIAEPNDVLKERLRWLLKGPVAPNRTDDTQPYNVQFELCVGAALTHAGIQGVRLEEPDWRIVAGDREIGIAAKRVSSAKNYAKLVRKAISQMRAHGCPGMIVLNFDPQIATDEPAAAAARVTAMVKEGRELIRTLNAEDVVFGLFGFATSFQVLWSPVGGAVGIEVFTHGELIEPDLSNASKIRAWFGRIGGNIMRSIRRAMQEMPV